MPITVPQPGNDITAELFGKPVADQVNANTTAIAALQPGVWTALPFNANATDLGNNQPCQYRKLGDVVQIRGVFRFLVAVAQNTEVIFTNALPVGYRPPVNLISFGICGWVAEATCRINVNAAGTLSCKPHMALDITQGNFVAMGAMMSYSVT